MRFSSLLGLTLALALGLAACQPGAAPQVTEVAASPTTAPTNPPPTATIAPTATWTATPTAVPTDTPPPTATFTPLPTTASAAESEPGGASKTIRISNFRFNPSNLEVKVGTRVTWTNQDEYEHTITADDGTFNSGALNVGDAFSFTFEQPGAYAYHCEFHSGMKGVIKVVP